MRSKGIIHGDLKPENICLQNKPERDIQVKIIDFGSGMDQNHLSKTLTNYMGSNWYRAPECPGVQEMPITPQFDMWSFGCIIFELWEKALFSSFTSYETGLKCRTRSINNEKLQNPYKQYPIIFAWLEKIGMPPQSFELKYPKFYKFCFDHYKFVVKTNPIKMSNQITLDFVLKFLQWDPEERLTPDQALLEFEKIRSELPRTPIELHKVSSFV